MMADSVRSTEMIVDVRCGTINEHVPQTPRISPPPFSQALDAAIKLYVTMASARIHDEIAAEVGDRPARTTT